jgi:hypothetical protein
VRSALRKSGVGHVRVSFSGTAQTENSPAGKLSPVAKERAAIEAAQSASRPSPAADTAPIPVTTTGHSFNNLANLLLIISYDSLHFLLR